MSDQIHDPSLNKNVNYSYSPFTRDRKNIDRTARARIEQTYGKLPTRFEANEGQTDARVKFMARGAGYSVFLTGDEAVMQLRKQELKSEGTADRHPEPRRAGEREGKDRLRECRSDLRRRFEAHGVRQMAPIDIRGGAWAIA